jgi:hypothetical protein
MIKNKAILQELSERKQRISCDNCIHCNLQAFYSGHWYCKNRSVFDIPVEIDECFQRRSL